MRWVALIVTLTLWGLTWPQILPPEADLPPCHMMGLIALTGAWTVGEFIKHRRRTMPMPDSPFDIERLVLPATDADIDSLAGLLVDAVASGAAVSFLAPLSHAQARAWWAGALSAMNPRGVVLVAREATNRNIVGTVQLQPAWAPNQPHRAEVCKLIVHSRSARAGLGRRLMEAVEQSGRDAGFTLLTLDARRGGVADHLYDKLRWTRVGVIPRYAVNPDGQGLHDTVIYYKELT